MRYSIVTAAFLATVVSANYPVNGPLSVYATEEITSTVVSKTTYAVTTSAAAGIVTYAAAAIPTYAPSSSAPAYPTYANTSIAAAPPATYPVESIAAGVPATTPAAVPTYPANAPLVSTIAVSTCVPTVIYVTVNPAPPAPTGPSATKGTGVPYGSAPVASGTGVPYGNGTVPAPTATPSSFQGAASNVQSSMIMVAFAGVAALIFA